MTQSVNAEVEARGQGRVEDAWPAPHGALVRAAVRALYLAPHLYLKTVVLRRLASLCRTTRTLVLSYDDGPGRDLTPRLLELLAERDALGTFFLLGWRVEAAPDLVDQVRGAGHELGCHSYRHLNAWKFDGRLALEDVEKGYTTLERWIGDDAIFRPPHGKMTLSTWRAVRRRRSPIAWWTVDSGDTWDPPPAPRSVVERVMRAGGGVVLMHDHHRAERADFVLETTSGLLDAAEREGLTVRTMGELLSSDGQ